MMTTKDLMQAYLDLQRTALELNADDFHVFANYSGHVNAIHVNINVGGWSDDATNRLTLRAGYLGWDDAQQSIEGITADLIEINKLYREGNTSLTELKAKFEGFPF